MMLSCHHESSLFGTLKLATLILALFSISLLSFGLLATNHFLSIKYLVILLLVDKTNDVVNIFSIRLLYVLFVWYFFLHKFILMKVFAGSNQCYHSCYSLEILYFKPNNKKSQIHFVSE